MTTTPEETQDLPPAPVAEELSSEPAGKVRDDAMMHNQAMVEFYPGKRPRIGEPVYTHPQTAIDVDALSEFLESNGFLGYSFGLKEKPQAARDLSIRICNWIEEQQSE